MNTKVSASFQQIFQGDDIGEDLRQFLVQHKEFNGAHIKALILAVGDTYQGLSHVAQFADVQLSFWVDESLKACWSFDTSKKATNPTEDPFFRQMGRHVADSAIYQDPYLFRRELLNKTHMNSGGQPDMGTRAPEVSPTPQLPDYILAELLESFSLLQTQRIPLGLKGVCPDAIDLMDMIKQRLKMSVRGLGMFAQGDMNRQGFVTFPPVYGMGVGYPPVGSPISNALATMNSEKVESWSGGFKFGLGEKAVHAENNFINAFHAWQGNAPLYKSLTPEQVNKCFSVGVNTLRDYIADLSKIAESDQTMIFSISVEGQGVQWKICSNLTELKGVKYPVFFAGGRV